MRCTHRAPNARLDPGPSGHPGLRLPSTAIHAPEYGGGAAGTTTTSARPLLRREKESIDYVINAGSATSPSTSLQQCAQPLDHHPLVLDGMLIDQDPSDHSFSVCTTSPTIPTTSSPTSRPPRTGRRQQANKKPVGRKKRPTPYARKPETL